VPTGPGISAEPLCGGAANWRRARDYRVSTLKLCSSCTSNFGAVSFLHRFGSALEAHVHLHVCVTEGIFVPPADGARCDAPPAFLPGRPINQADLAALGVCLVFYQKKVPDPFWAQGERDRHRLLTQTEPVPAAAAADMLTWENSGFSVDATCSDHAQ
jgi:hypothetical protein